MPRIDVRAGPYLVTIQGPDVRVNTGTPSKPPVPDIVGTGRAERSDEAQSAAATVAEAPLGPMPLARSWASRLGPEALGSTKTEAEGGLQLDAREREIISCLSLGTCSWAPDVAAMAGIPQSRLAGAIESLVDAGLVAHVRFGNRSFVTLLPAGGDHPDYDASARKAPEADVVRAIGMAKVLFLQIVEALETVCSNDITAALPRGIFGSTSVSTGNIKRQLIDAGYITEIWPPVDKHTDVKLTDHGKRLVRMMRPFVPPLDGSVLERARDQRQRRLEKRSILREPAKAQPREDQE